MCVATSDSLSPLNDADLLKRFCQTQCEAAFGELVERYGKLVMSKRPSGETHSVGGNAAVGGKRSCRPDFTFLSDMLRD